MWYNALIAIAAGILAASSYIVAKKPDAKKHIDKMLPYQGFIGIAVFIWGIYNLIGVLQTMGYLGLGTSVLIAWLVALVATLAMLGVGFILGYALISQYVLSKNAEAMKKGEEIRTKLLKYQIPLGFILIIVGILQLVLTFTVRI